MAHFGQNNSALGGDPKTKQQVATPPVQKTTASAFVDTNGKPIQRHVIGENYSAQSTMAISTSAKTVTANGVTMGNGNYVAPTIDVPPTADIPTAMIAPTVKVASISAPNGNVSIHAALRATIEALDGSESITGGIGDGSGANISSNWESPFEQFVMGNTKFATVAALLSSGTGLSVINQTTMTQVWRGTRPITFDLSIVLIATKDDPRLVNDCLDSIARMMSPSDSASSTEGTAAANAAAGYIKNARAAVIASTEGAVSKSLGQTLSGAVLLQPSKVSVTVGIKTIYPNCVIESMSYDLDKPKDANGYYLMNVAKLSVQTVTMQLRTDIKI